MLIADYLERIQEHSGCSHECYALALLYIERVLRSHPHMEVDPFSCHRLLLTGVMLAHKYHDDAPHDNAYYAQVGGIEVQQLNTLESQFLSLINWKLYVDRDEFDRYRDLVCRA